MRYRDDSTGVGAEVLLSQRTDSASRWLVGSSTVVGPAALGAGGTVRRGDAHHRRGPLRPCLREDNARVHRLVEL